EHPAAVAAAGVEDRGAVPPVGPEAVTAATPRASQAVRVEDLDELLGAGVLVHELGDGEVHGGLRRGDSRCGPIRRVYPARMSDWVRQAPIAAHEPTMFPGNCRQSLMRLCVCVWNRRSRWRPPASGSAPV